MWLGIRLHCCATILVLLTIGTALAHPNPKLQQVNAAIAAKNWQQAIDLLNPLIARQPKWEYLSLLGDAQYGSGLYEDAIANFERGLSAAGAEKVTRATQAGIGHMLTFEGDAYLKLHRNNDAIAAFTKAAAVDPHPAVAYFNLCATQYNTGVTDGALAACDKAIAADPKRADAYFIEGSLLVGEAKTDPSGKVTAPPGTVETLRKYLALAPNGPHATDVKQMLDFVK